MAPLIDRIGRVGDWFEADDDGASFASLRGAEMGGRPLGNEEFVTQIERTVGRSLQRRKPSQTESNQLMFDIGNE